MELALTFAAACIGCFVLGMIVIYLVFARARRLDSDIADNLYTLLRIAREEALNLELRLAQMQPSRSRRNLPDEEHLATRRMTDSVEARIAGELADDGA